MHSNSNVKMGGGERKGERFWELTSQLAQPTRQATSQLAYMTRFQVNERLSQTREYMVPEDQYPRLLSSYLHMSTIQMYI